LTVLIVLLLLSLGREVARSVVLDTTCSASVELDGSLKSYGTKNKYTDEKLEVKTHSEEFLEGSSFVNGLS
jgi:hypothetical protein